MRYLLLLLVLSFIATSTFFFVEARKVRRSLCAALSLIVFDQQPNRFSNANMEVPTS
ncbi:hypothetical protein L210DRAFT_943897 [Boletus edulis BED1]|uniref:Uncharacterized protein n=1 Tax=Boletus edulis BED1 TaxID=1328754 RepID=A0AAD4BV47_BOLED|nr:hypothetical protein L210DRAFT_943897 [Boletus edulis BED1]